MLAGEVQRRQVQIDALRAEVAKYSEKIAALDASIAFADSRVNAAALGRIRAPYYEYGGRGELTKFVLAEVCAAGSVGISTGDMNRRVIKRFDIPVFTAQERENYLHTVTTRLRRLEEKGVIESALGMSGRRQARLWRKRESFDSFSELLNQRSAIEGARHG